MPKLGVSEPIVTKFDRSDYITSQAKTQSDRPSAGVRANKYTITLAWFLFYLFVTQIFGRFPPEAISIQFDLQDINPRLLHSWR